MVLGNLSWWCCFEQGDWTRWYPQMPSDLNCHVILWKSMKSSSSKLLLLIITQQLTTVEEVDMTEGYGYTILLQDNCETPTSKLGNNTLQCTNGCIFGRYGKLLTSFYMHTSISALFKKDELSMVQRKALKTWLSFLKLSFLLKT